jgi:phosphoglycerol transferase MdoB-like AlkP superfamily enzyme
VTGVATIGSVLRRKGYRTEFVYGGDGRFDRMRSFATENGWDAFLDDALVGESSYPSDAFRTIWGVADETMFAKLLARQRQARTDGVRFFGTALTVSNHKPFLTPDSKDMSLRTGELRGMLPPAALLAAASAVSWCLIPRRARRTLGVALAIAWGISGTAAWMSVQPKDSRDAAVRYADRAFAEYLDQAKAEGLLDHTVVLFVGDHGARVYGSEEIPAASYRVPAMFVAPDAKYHGATISRLCSQIDLAPTLLSLAGIDFTAPFFGQDLLREPAEGPGRAYLIHNRDIGELTDTILVVLGIQRTTTGYRRANRGSDTFELARREPPAETLSHAAAAVFQSASGLIETGRFRLSDAP